MNFPMLASISPGTEFVIPLSVLCTLLAALVVATWRLANRMRDLTDSVKGGWTFRDQERWALELERANRERGNPLWVPDVERAPKDGGA